MHLTKNKYRWRYRLTVGFLSVLVLIMAGELICRFQLGLGSPPLSKTHPTIEYMFRPNQDVQRFHNWQYYNRFGMRSANFAEDRADPNELRVLILGDSVVNGGSLTDQADLATSIVANELESDVSPHKVVVGNISAGSWGPGNQLAYIREFGLFSADVVVLVISSHDAADVPTFGALDPNTHPTSAPISALSEAAWRYLPRYLPQWNVLPVEQPENALDLNLQRGLADLRALLAETTASGAEVIVIQYLSRDEIESGETEAGFGLIRDVCDQLQVTVLSTQKLFDHAVVEGKSPFRDSIHPNELGQRLLATCILETVRETSALRSRRHEE